MSEPSDERDNMVSASASASSFSYRTTRSERNVMGSVRIPEEDAYCTDTAEATDETSRLLRLREPPHEHSSVLLAQTPLHNYPALRQGPLQRNYSSVTEYSTSALKFLKCVKKIQQIKHMERLLRHVRNQKKEQQQAAQAALPESGLTTTITAATPPISLLGSEDPTDPGTTISTTKVDPNSTGLLPSTETTTTAFSNPSGAPVPPMGGSSGERSTTTTTASSSDIKIQEYFRDLIFGKGILSVMLLAAPLAVWSAEANWNATAIFWFNFIVMIPLASILGDFTEEVALHTNEMIGGLINATFGNAVEVVVALQALMANEIRVVQASMLGSIFSNLLLVLGGCFFFGGLKYKEQSFNTTAATANMALLAVSAIALVLPTPFASYYDLHDEHVLVISRLAAIFLLFMYVQLLIFQLNTHADLFEDSSSNNDGNNSSNQKQQRIIEPDEGKDGVFRSSPSVVEVEADNPSLGEIPAIPFWMACAGLLGTTLLVTIFSEYLVQSIDGFVEHSGISRTFVGIILLPIVGNAVEHVTAITVARKDKMDLAMGVAVGSCTQISLFVVPLTVLVGWACDRDMTLNFPHFEIILFVMSIFTVSICLSTPKCHWLEGSLLMTTYLLIAVGFWFENIITANPAAVLSSLSPSPSIAH